MQNQFVVGGLAVLFLGWLVAHLRTVAAAAVQLIAHRFFVSGLSSFIQWKNKLYEKDKIFISTIYLPL